MTKRDLVIKISGETGLIQQQVLSVIQKTLEQISNALADGENVELRNFGVFEVKHSKARIGRNPNAPEIDVRIPPRAVVKFKPGKGMRQRVVKLSKGSSSGDGSESSRSRDHSAKSANTTATQANPA